MKRSRMNKTGNNKKEERYGPPFESCLHATHTKRKRTAFGRSVAVVVVVVVLRIFIDVRSTHEFFVLFWFNIHKNLVHGRTTELKNKLPSFPWKRGGALLCDVFDDKNSYSNEEGKIPTRKSSFVSMFLFHFNFVIFFLIFHFSSFSFILRWDFSSRFFVDICAVE